MNAVIQSTTGKVALGLLLMAMPFVIAYSTPLLGPTRGVYSALAGVLIGMAFERPFRPYNVTSKRWMGRGHWVEIALVCGVVLGLVVSVADGLGGGIELTPLLEKIWIPLYRSVMFAAGLTLLRRAVWEASRTPRPRGFRGTPVPPVTPALPRAEPAAERRNEHRY